MNGPINQRQRLRYVACVFVLACTMTSVSSHVFAQDASSVVKDVATVEPFVTETTFLVVKVDPNRLALPNLPDSVKAVFPGGPDAYGRWATSVTKGFDRFRAISEGQVTYATVGIPISQNEWPTFLVMKETSEQSQKQFIDFLGSIHEAQSVNRDGLTIVMPAHSKDLEARLNAIVPSSRDELTDAFDAVKDYPIQLLLLPPDYVRQTVAELMPDLPRQLGGGPSGLLTDGLQWASLGIDVADSKLELVIHSSTDKAAQDLAAHLPNMMLGSYDGLANVKSTVSRDEFLAMISQIKPQVKGSRISIQLDVMKSAGDALKVLASAPAVVGEQMRRRQNSDKFKSILVAMHNYYDVNQSFPPRDEDRDDDGKSGLSWRVHILPYVGEQELYGKFDFDQPWDSPHNKPLIEQMPTVYESHWLGIKPGHTTFQTPVGKDTIYGGTKATKFHLIIDGTSNTITLVEVKPELSVPWTAPTDYAFDPKAAGKGLRIGDDARFLAALADGSVQLLRGDISNELMLQLFQKGDRKPFRWDDVR